MTLANLVATGQLKAHSAERSEVQRVLADARRNLKDAKLEELSPAGRFHLAYQALMQAALAALMANGYRPDTKHPGHHATTIQSLPKTIGIDGGRIQVLDALRRKRNLSDYLGAEVDDASAKVCRDEAEKLVGEVAAWLKANRPDLA